MKRACLAFAPALLFVSVAAHAQEDAGVESDERAPAPPVTAPPAAPIAAVVPRTETTASLRPVDVLALDPDGFSGRARRLVISKQRQLRRLGDAIAAEGPEYDSKKESRHAGAIAGGVVLEVGGGAALISAFFVGVITAFAGWGCQGDDDDCSEEAERESERGRNEALVLASLGVVAVAIGIPLLVTGHRGRNRQKALKKKAEILDISELADLRITTSFTREGTAGGLVLSGSF